jgi:hypothetical protein
LRGSHAHVRQLLVLDSCACSRRELHASDHHVRLQRLDDRLVQQRQLELFERELQLDDKLVRGSHAHVRQLLVLDSCACSRRELHASDHHIGLQRLDDRLVQQRQLELFEYELHVCAEPLCGHNPHIRQLLVLDSRAQPWRHFHEGHDHVDPHRLDDRFVQQRQLDLLVRVLFAKADQRSMRLDDHNLGELLLQRAELGAQHQSSAVDHHSQLRGLHHRFVQQRICKFFKWELRRKRLYLYWAAISRRQVR